MSGAGFEDIYPLHTDEVRNFVLNLLEHAALVDDKGRRLEVAIRRKRPKLDKEDPEVKARKLMHVFVGQLAKHVGCTPNEMRWDLRTHLLPTVERVNHVTGEVLSEPLSTTDLRWEADDSGNPTLSDFIGWIQQLASEHFNIELKSNKETDMLANREITDEQEDARYNR